MNCSYPSSPIVSARDSAGAGRRHALECTVAGAESHPHHVYRAEQRLHPASAVRQPNCYIVKKHERRFVVKLQQAASECGDQRYERYRFGRQRFDQEHLKRPLVANQPGVDGSFGIALTAEWDEAN